MCHSLSLGCPSQAFSACCHLNPCQSSAQSYSFQEALLVPWALVNASSWITQSLCHSLPHQGKMDSFLLFLLLFFLACIFCFVLQQTEHLLTASQTDFTLTHTHKRYSENIFESKGCVFLCSLCQQIFTSRDKMCGHPQEHKIIQYVLFWCLAFFTQHVWDSSVLLCANIVCSFSNCCGVFHCMHMTQLTYPFCCWWPLGLFPVDV